jgi:hypothetical protein
METHERNEIMEQDAVDDAQERRWRRWIAGRCYCTYPIPVSDPSRRPSHCERCGGYIPAPVPVIDIDAETERIAELERENRILRVAILVMTAIAAVAVYLYDKAVTTLISGGTP